ncbi:MAG: type I-F CRISPR-associated protein Csy1 [Alcanivorax sp.]|uniref:type I-F CRISPR-associated protein Csy1 n=1 Tax=Alloalcanivorax marinus TaxID=1177169 RepID=UPI001959F806|nr:type I-F CRISPR-associated protein Csy1 [Alloalcanivorax marinus]MBM7332393.1 type I-F CRISPR-associated protein Csy1 [Alloalcanivorax marinus]
MEILNDPSVRGLRAAMEQFLSERLQGKLEKLADDDPKREALRAQFQFEHWVESAASRASQIQLVTHSLKPIHPDAKGSNLYVEPGDLVHPGLVSSGVMGSDFQADVVGNAAALDVYKFLKVEHEGRSVLERVLEDDAELRQALSDDADQARAWVEAFAGLVAERTGAASHTKAKQVYWLVGEDPTRDDHFHLLAPLYATSLAHRVFLAINEDRFGEAAKEARKARRESKPCDWGYRDYPNLAVQKLGGTKPQNISQLNSERAGNNYLLASLPPIWESPEVPAPLRTDSVFPRFGRRREVRWLISQLARFLEQGPDPVVATRKRRDGYVDALIDELVLFAGELSVLEPGWSADSQCRLNEAETLWLDPHRADYDAVFQAKRESEDWPDQVRHRFANWLNRELSRRLPMGDPEHAQWTGALKAKLDALQEVLPHV